MTRCCKSLVLLAVLFVAGMLMGQVFRSGGRGYARLEGGAWVNEDTVRTARETVSHSVTLPEWSNPPEFARDVFTFTRVIFPSDPSHGDRLGLGRLGWWVDYPDADLNLSHRLQQMTSMQVDPDARVLKLTDPDLFNYPFIFMVHVEGIDLSSAEEDALRDYLQLGGSLLVTDFWGTDAWERLKWQMAKVLPGRSWTELTMDHPVFHTTFALQGPMHRLRVPTMQFWDERSDPDDPDSYISIRYRGEGSEVMRIWALLDDKERIMALAVHNSDISDGWERESENEGFFKTFSEPRSYPLAINIILYLMTH